MLHVFSFVLVSKIVTNQKFYLFFFIFKTGKIYVKEFNYPHNILFSHCDLSPDCTQDKVRALTQKLSTTSGEITNELVTIMSPELKPDTVRMDLKEGMCFCLIFTYAYLHMAKLKREFRIDYVSSL